MIEAGKTLYIAEDNATNRRLFKAILLPHYSVFDFADGQEALETIKLDPSKPDLLITDFNMPRMNGEELVEEVTKLWLPPNPHRTVPIIMVTGEDFDPKNELFRARMYKIGVDALLTKPFMQDELLQTVAALLEKFKS